MHTQAANISRTSTFQRGEEINIHTFGDLARDRGGGMRGAAEAKDFAHTHHSREPEGSEADVRTHHLQIKTTTNTWICYNQTGYQSNLLMLETCTGDRTYIEGLF